MTLNEPDQLSRKVEVRTPLEDVLTPDGLAHHRHAYLDAIRAYNQHVMDHAWETEDRHLS